ASNMGHRLMGSDSRPPDRPLPIACDDPPSTPVLSDYARSPYHTAEHPGSSGHLWLACLCLPRPVSALGPTLPPMPFAACGFRPRRLRLCAERPPHTAREPLRPDHRLR